MMTAAQVIARLDEALQRTGENVIIRRYAGTGNQRPKVELAARAFIRPMEAEDLVGNIDSTFAKVILSPTGKTALLPLVKGDKIVVAGKERNVEIPKPIKFQNELARIVLVVGG
jgi:hypothetical protein